MATRFSPPEEIRNCQGLTEIQFRRAVRTKYQKSVDQWWKIHAARGAYILRQQQFEEARNGSVTALKWLGIQHLGQTQKVETLFKPGEEGKEERKAEEIKGFAILTPNGMEPPKQGDANTSSPSDEKPAVELLIQEESEAAANQVQPQSNIQITVPAYPTTDEA